jgi:hypothetical protein
MADITYIVNENSPQSIPGFEQYSNIDKNLIDSFEINSLFDPEKHFTELHVYSLTDELLESDSNYTGYAFRPDAGSSGKPGASNISIDPIQDSINYGYPNGGVKLLYHFIKDIFTEDKATAEFYISDISGDRTELRLLASTLDDSVVEQVAILYAETLKNGSYFDGFRLNFGNNDLFIGINIGIIPYNDQSAVRVKLYEPLPDIYGIGSTLNIVEVISDSIAYEVESEAPIEVVTQPYLRPANFNIEVQDNNVVPSQYFNYDELFSYPVNNSNSQIYSVFNEKGIDISVDYTNYDSFVHFSSAQERLINFKYKLDLITQHSASLSSISSAPIALAGTSGSKDYYNGLIKGIISNFDHYERFLYYESGSNSWPKANATKPYTNAVSTTNIANSWYTSQIDNALKYDSINNNALVNTVPAYLRDDANNENYVTFINMIGQHFDNLWLYGKAVTDKYNADNRINFGISKDLVGEALKNFGVKLYTSNKSIEDLFATIIGQPYQSGSEQITNYVTASYTGSNAPIQPVSYDSYQKEIQKRLYHNLPLLLSSKGTERGLRALINCYGIPSDILQIKYYGGRNTNERPFFGDYRHYTSSLGKIRLDHTGSIVTGSTLSGNTSIIKRDTKYTDDLHNIEVGFSPTDNVDAYITANLYPYATSTFSIDEYIGDPRNLSSGSYAQLDIVAETILSSLERYDLQDYVRLIKFFDNTIFKTIKDFIPARVVADTGIIIKPNLLNRSKAKSVLVSVTQPEYTASIVTAFIEAADGGAYGYSNSYSTAWLDEVQTPFGTGYKEFHTQEEPKYNGELSGSLVVVTDGKLSRNNPYLYEDYSGRDSTVLLIKDFPGGGTICAMPASYAPILITSSPEVIRDITEDFAIPGDAAVTYRLNSQVISNPTEYTFPTNYTTYIVTASKDTIANCTSSITYYTEYCTIGIKGTSRTMMGATNNPSQDVTSWFSLGASNNPANISYTITSGSTTQTIATPTAYNFTGVFTSPNLTSNTFGYVTIKAIDTATTACSQSLRLDIYPNVINQTLQLRTYKTGSYLTTNNIEDVGQTMWNFPLQFFKNPDSRILDFLSTPNSPIADTGFLLNRFTYYIRTTYSKTYTIYLNTPPNVYATATNPVSLTIRSLDTNQILMPTLTMPIGDSQEIGTWTISTVGQEINFYLDIVGPPNTKVVFY